MLIICQYVDHAGLTDGAEQISAAVVIVRE